MNVTVELAHVPGCIFESEHPGTACFVPLDLIHFTGAGTEIDLVGYAQSGWSVQNLRCAPPEVAGAHLFPNAAQMMEPDEPAARAFLDRASRCTAPSFGGTAQ